MWLVWNSGNIFAMQGAQIYFYLFTMASESPLREGHFFIHIYHVDRRLSRKTDYFKSYFWDHRKCHVNDCCSKVQIYLYGWMSNDAFMSVKCQTVKSLLIDIILKYPIKIFQEVLFAVLNQVRFRLTLAWEVCASQWQRCWLTL